MMPAAAARNHVLWLLLGLGAPAALTLGFLTVAPNRLISGRALMLADVISGASSGPLALMLGSSALLVIAAWRRPAPRMQTMVALAAAALLCALLWLAGDEAARLALQANTAAQAAGGSSPVTQRVSFGGAFWCLMLMAALIAADALQRLALPPVRRAAALGAMVLPLLALLLLGRLDELSIMKEWAQREEVFREAFFRHLLIVASALLPALAIGLPLGVAAVRRERLGRYVFALLGTLQTIPSIALFALLIAPLAALGALWPASGIRGVGLAPALLALVAYALLPIVHGVAAGLKQIDAGVLQAAAGMGLGRWRRLLQVELPLALPALISALRVAAVQLVGTAVVAALVGAGGLGALVFQGLGASAIDLVLLGVLPVVALAVVLDALLGALAAAVQRAPARAGV